MALTLYPCLREQANFCFARLQKKPASRDQICDIFAAAVQGYKGASILEDWHGTYAYPLMVIDMLPLWAGRNVTRFYTEFVPSGEQPIIDQWQKTGDDTDITNYFDRQKKGYSKGMWQYYWRVLQEANRLGMRIVGLDKAEIASGYGPIFDAPFKTMHWESVIQKDQKTSGPDEKYIVYGGISHGTDFGGVLIGIHQRMGIPRIILKEGDYAIARHMFSDTPSFSINIPPSPKQDHRERLNTVRTVPVKWPI